MCDFIFESDDEHIVGKCISNQKYPTVYQKRDNLSVKIDGDVSMVAVVRFADSGDVPLEGTAKSLTVDVDEALLDMMRQLFEKRPVWQRAALEETVGECAPAKFTGALRKCSYLFLDGPWRKCYVRFGYDPRKNSEAKIWQIIDFRDPFLSDSRLIEDNSVKDVHFRRPPTNRSQLYQLCDIDDLGIQSVLVSSQDHCSAKSGWLNESQLESVRNQMKIKSDSMRRQKYFFSVAFFSFI